MPEPTAVIQPVSAASASCYRRGMGESDGHSKLRDNLTTTLVLIGGLLLAGLAGAALQANGIGQWVANGVFVALVAVYCALPGSGRRSSMRMFLACTVLLLPIVYGAMIGLFIANEDAGFVFLDLCLRVGLLSQEGPDAWLPALVLFWWGTIFLLVSAVVGLRNLVVHFVLD